MDDLWLAFEGGGTKTRLLLTDAAGTVYAYEQGGSASSLYLKRAWYIRDTRRRLERLAREAEQHGGRVTAAGVAGPMNPALVSELIQAAFGPIPLVWSNEGDLALAQYDLACGVSLVAGTGASCRCIDESGHMVGCGGFGPQFGDEGSACWIGREAVTAVFRAREGRGPQTTLDERIYAALDLTDIRDIYCLASNSGYVPAPVVAGLAQEVHSAAQDGDACARRILHAAGRALGRLVLDTLERSAIHQRPVPVVPTGGVFRSGHFVLTPLKRVLRGSNVPCTLLDPVAEPVMGLFKVMHAQFKEDAKGVS